MRKTRPVRLGLVAKAGVLSLCCGLSWPVLAQGVDAHGHRFAAAHAAPAPERVDLLRTPSCAPAAPASAARAGRAFEWVAPGVVAFRDAPAAKVKGATAIMPGQALRVAPSALVSSRPGEVERSVVAVGADQFVLFTHRGADRRGQLLGAVWQTAADGGMRSTASWFHRPSTSSAANARLNLIGLEHLYEYLLRQDPGGSFGFRSVDQASAPWTQPLVASASQGAALAAIAAARECAAASLANSGAKPPRWEVVTMQPVAQTAGTPPDPDVLGVSVRGASGPIDGATVTIARPPDMVCTATSDAQGIARCRLIDAHGHAHEHEHHDDDHSPTVVTFSGKVSPTSIALPTTLLLPR